MRRSTPQVYTAEEKAEFFQRLAENPNVSAVANEMGFPRMTCYAWAHKAGIFTSEACKVNPRREEFFRLRAAVERSSRFVMLGHLGRERSAHAVRDSLITTIQHLPDALRGTLTWDLGSERAEHRALASPPTWMCTSPTQARPGSEEATRTPRGCWSQYFARGIDLSRHNADELKAVADELDNRPRKTLDWGHPGQTPCCFTGRLIVSPLRRLLGSKRSSVR